MYYNTYHLVVLKTKLLFAAMASPVAFSAYASVTTGYDDGAIVQFDSVVTNIGNNYNSDLSVFQCPSDGTYLFSVSFLSGETTAMEGSIVKDGSELLSSRADNDNDVQSSVVAVTECLASQTVWVECVGDNRELIGTNMSSFSGILVTAYA